MELIVDYVTKSYTISEQRMFVFSDADNRNDIYITFNIEATGYSKTPNTISIHRKKETNTLYTVNALNTIIRGANNGVMDKSFAVDWTLYHNSLLMTNANALRRIQLQLMRRIDL